MSDTEKRRVVFSVKKLFDKIRQGRIHFTDAVPQTVNQIKAVRFDVEGNPIYATIGPLVRALARVGIENEILREVEERERSIQLRQLLGKPVPVAEDRLRECVGRKSFSSLGIELYKEATRIVELCSYVHTGISPEETALPRNQAVCAGLLVRISKFMTAVSCLFSEKPDCGDVVLVLNRCIVESATNLRFLVRKNEDRFFDQFVKFSFGPEREFYDLIQKNIEKRGGETLPIEERMMKSINRACQGSGVILSDVRPKTGDWGGGLRNRLITLGMGEAYSMLQRLPSHAVHGTWVDLFQHHLTYSDNSGFRPDLTWSRVDCRLLLPICVFSLAAGHTYLEAYFTSATELDPLYERISDLIERIKTVEASHENWFSTKRK